MQRKICLDENDFSKHTKTVITSCLIISNDDNVTNKLMRSGLRNYSTNDGTATVLSLTTQELYGTQ